MENQTDRLELLGKKGFIVSICYGPCGDNGPMYSIDVMTVDGDSFDAPFAANSFNQCLDIAENEIEERGWANQLSETQ